MSESASDEDVGDRFYNLVMENSKAIIYDSKKLLSMVSEEKSEGSVQATSVETLQHLFVLENLIEQYVSKLPEERGKVHQDFLNHSCKSLGSAVNELIDSATIASSNPYDFLSQQRLRNCCKKVAESIKGLISAAHSLRETSQDQAVPNNEQYDEVMVDVANDARNAILNFNNLRTAALNATEQEFVQVAKGASEASTELLITARSFKFKEPADRLKEATIGAISSAKILFKNRNDSVFSDQMDMALAKVADAIRMVVYSIKDLKLKDPTASSENSSVSNSTSPEAEDVPPTERSSAEAAKERERLVKIMEEKKREHAKKLSTPEIEVPQTEQLTKKQLKEKEKAEKKIQKEAQKEAERREKKLRKENKHRKNDPILKPARNPSTRNIRTLSIPPLLALSDPTETLIGFFTEKFPKSFKKEWEALPQETKTQWKEQLTKEIRKSNSLSLVTSSELQQLQQIHQTAVRVQFERRFSIPRVAPTPRGATPDYSALQAADEAKVSRELISVARAISEVAVDFLVYSAEATNDMNLCISTAKELLQLVHRSLTLADMAGRLEKNSLSEALVMSAVETVSNSPARGKLVENLIEVATGASPYARLVEGTLQLRISREMESVQVLSTQLVTVILSLSVHLGKSRVHATLLQLAGTAESFIRAKEKLLDSVETARYLASLGPRKQAVDDLSLTMLDYDEEDINIWDDPEIVSKPRKDEEPVKSGSINKLVTILSSEENIDNKFLKTFVTTYQSFTTPAKLFDKLLQRYNAPMDRIPHKTIVQIQQRVGIVVKYWVEKQFKDFNEALISKLFDFYDNRLFVDGHQNLAELLRKELSKRVAERSAQFESLRSSPKIDITLPDLGRLSISQYFYALNDTEIARQLTLIDFAQFELVEPAELLNQAWNKESLKHRSPNVLGIISRANTVSFWIASLILWHDNIQERSKMVQKIVRIAEELRRHGNFHTLMGIIAGMNMSSVTRLKRTMEEVPPHVKDSLKALEKLMSPASSYKSYRSSLHKTSPPCLPYMYTLTKQLTSSGTYLSDLTFIEDGNPDFTKNNRINFQKRELVHNAIAEIAQYQQTAFQFPVVEPISTFLRELPACKDKELYELSLKYEPRDTFKSPTYSRTQKGSIRKATHIAKLLL